MFHVFGLTGRIASGGPEDVRHVASVRGAARVRALSHSGLTADGEDHVTLGGVGRRQGGGDAPPRTSSVLAAYASVQQAEAESRQPLTRVEQVMSRQVFSLAADLPLDLAWQQLGARGVAQAPVLSGGPAPRLVGLLLRADLLRPDGWPSPADGADIWRAHSAAFWQQRVADQMWTPVPAVSPEADLRRVAAVLLQSRLPGLPVVDESGTLAGFISRSDLLRALVADPPLDLWT